MAVDIKATDMLRSQKVAESNFVRVAQSLPDPLCEREDNLTSEFHRHTGTRLEQLRSLYDFMDELYTCVDQHTPCGPGCTACCYYAVSITELEVQLIETETPHARRSNPSTVDKPHGMPCPFLSRGVCSVYESRPFVCRRHITLDDSPRWCATDVCHDIELPQLNFSEVFAVFDGLQDTNEQTNDIREWFASPGRIT